MIRHDELQNRLLARIDPGEYERLAGAAELVPMTKGQELAVPWKRLDFCWFPLSGVVSAFASDADGEEAAVCLIGREGLVDAATVLGDDICTTRMLVHENGQALRVSHDHLARQVKSSPVLSEILLSYVRFKAVQSDMIMLAAARRPLQSRLAAFVLMWNDRTDGAEIGVTHLDLAMLLGVRRAGVSTALRRWMDAGVIAQHRGKLVIRDRRRLREFAGAGYGEAEEAYERLVGCKITDQA